MSELADTVARLETDIVFFAKAMGIDGDQVWADVKAKARENALTTAMTLNQAVLAHGSKVRAELKNKSFAFRMVEPDRTQSILRKLTSGLSAQALKGLTNISRRHHAKRVKKIGVKTVTGLSTNPKEGD